MCTIAKIIVKLTHNFVILVANMFLGVAITGVNKAIVAHPMTALVTHFLLTHTFHICIWYSHPDGFITFIYSCIMNSGMQCHPGHEYQIRVGCMCQKGVDDMDKQLLPHLHNTMSDDNTLKHVYNQGKEELTLFTFCSDKCYLYLMKFADHFVVDLNSWFIYVSGFEKRAHFAQRLNFCF